MRKIDNLLSFYDNPRENGIFFAMYQSPLFQRLLIDMGITTAEQAHAIDMDYMYNNSGLKTCSCLLENFIRGLVVDDNDKFAVTLKYGKVSWDYIVTQVDQDIINFVLKTRYLYKWQQLFTNVTADFNALSPFHIDYSEKQTADLTSKDTSKNIIESQSETEDELTADNEGLISGFNSTEPVNTDEQKRNSTSKSNTTNNSEQNRTNDYQRTNEVDRTYVRSGNIGNQSQSELLIKQREYLQFVLLKQIYLDLDEVLTRSKYN